LHGAVFLVLVASLKIFAQRAITQHQAGWMADPRNLPLAAATVVVIVFLEVFRRRFRGFALVLIVLSALTFFICSFYLPFVSHSDEWASVSAYISLLILLSTALAALFDKNLRVGRILGTLIGLSLSALVVGFIYTFSSADFFGGNHAADAAVVLGGGVWGPHTPSPDLRGRLDAAALLYAKRETKKIAVTGGTRRFNTFESEIGAWYLRHIGIPAADILAEHKTLNTAEQILYVKEVLMDSLKMKRIVIVSDKWHLPRALLMCKWEHIRAKGYASDYKMSMQAELYWRTREAAGLQIYMLFGA
jgi:vancomycin permeability regulator SanA